MDVKILFEVLMRVCDEMLAHCFYSSRDFDATVIFRA